MIRTLQAIRPYFTLSPKQYVSSLVAVAVAILYTCFSYQHLYLLGAITLAALALLLFTLPRAERQYLSIFLGVGALATLTPVTAHTTYPPAAALFAFMMVSVVVLPQFFSNRVFGQHLIHFNLDWHRKWRWWEVSYVAFAALVAYLAFPAYFSDTGAYTAWNLEPNVVQLAVVFAGVMLVGMWEEFFFIGTVYNILRRYMPAVLANVVQATMFTMFLYRVGFRYYAVGFIFCYAFIQGLLFAKTKSLLCVLTVHFFVDLVLFLALVHAFFPTWMPIFIT